MDEIPGLNLGTASKTTELEYGRGWWNFLCSGEMRRYRKNTSGEGDHLD